MPDYSSDPRAVMTLDAGGTNFVFSAIRGNETAVDPFALAACGDQLQASLGALVAGFERVRRELDRPPVAISFAFPGPADYTHGIVLGPRNLPAYRDIPLVAFLEERFQLPAFINNDGDLFTVGEAASGLLPYINGLLERSGSSKRFRNLIGVTLGTGFGGGIVQNGELFRGDNSAAGEVWLLRHKHHSDWNIEEGASIRAVMRRYAECSGSQAPEPRVIAEIDAGRSDGDQAAAREAFRYLGEIAGDGLAIANTILDGLIVIGGGMAAAFPLFLPALVDEMNSYYTSPGGERFQRLIPRVFNLEDPVELDRLVRGELKDYTIPGTNRRVSYDGLLRTGVGITRLGTSQAVAIGAYAHALRHLDDNRERWPLRDRT
ncbi:MAG TPA: ROK family protein [Bryobacteraceae bacterium]|nr:ROK family protein [Bryobacteraceae bacterium]